MPRFIQIAATPDGPDYKPAVYALDNLGQVFAHIGETDRVTAASGAYWEKLPGHPEGQDSPSTRD